MASYLMLHGQRFSVTAFSAATGIVNAADSQHETRLFYLEKGFAVVEDERGYWTVSPGEMAWLPPYLHYDVGEYGNVAGWSMSLSPLLCNGTPEWPCALQPSGFIPLVLERTVHWQQDGIDGVYQPLSARQERLLQVFLDELNASIPVPGRLTLPKDKRLNFMARQLLARSGERKNLEDWVESTRMSSRSISRHFSRETGMSFAQWRQGASLLIARKWLAQGKSVQAVSKGVGYENVSTFIASFKKAFGRTPAQFRQLFL